MSGQFKSSPWFCLVQPCALIWAMSLGSERLKVNMKRTAAAMIHMIGSKASKPRVELCNHIPTTVKRMPCTTLAPTETTMLFPSKATRVSTIEALARKTTRDITGRLFQAMKNATPHRVAAKPRTMSIAPWIFSTVLMCMATPFNVIVPNLIIPHI